MKLTNKAIKAFKYRGGWDVRWDDAIPGFGVRIYPSGKKAFVLSYRAKGRKRLMVLGRYGADLTLTQARDRASKARVSVRDGEDPLEARRRDAQAKTFDDLIESFIEKHARPHKKTWKTDRDRLRRHTPRGWRRRKVSSITREDVSTVHARIGETRPYEANRFLDLLRVMFRFARLNYFVDANTDNPAEGIRKFREQQRARWATPEELPALATAIDSEPNVFVRAAVWLFILTAVRKNELLAARWEHVDWERGRLRLPNTKSGSEQTATLSGPAIAILQAIPRLEGNKHILPGAKKGHHIVNIDKAWRRIRKAAGIEDLRLHDLRRTAGSWMAQAGTDLQTIRDGLRHSNIATTLIYARLGEDAAREAFEEHGRRIMEAAGKNRPVEVAGGERDN